MAGIAPQFHKRGNYGCQKKMTMSDVSKIDISKPGAFKQEEGLMKPGNPLENYCLVENMQRSHNVIVTVKMLAGGVRTGTTHFHVMVRPGESKTSRTLYFYGEESIMNATIQRATFKSFYGDNLGITRPVIISQKTKICYTDNYGTGVYWRDWSVGGIIPDVKIWGRDQYSYCRNGGTIVVKTAYISENKLHTLNPGNLNYWGTDKVIYESWAETVEWAFTKDEYQRLGNIYYSNNARNYNHLGGHQNWLKSSTQWEYSPAFMDLTDHFNPRNNYGPSYPNDRITGYSLNCINNNILPFTGVIHTLKHRLKNNKTYGITNCNADDLYSFDYN